MRYFIAHVVFFVDRLLQNQQLSPGDELRSSKSLVNLTMQADGNLVLDRTLYSYPLWASNTPGQRVATAIMQGDGNFVLYSMAGDPLWATGTNGNPGAWVIVQDDGNLVVYSTGNVALWASNTVQDFRSPTFVYSDASGYRYDETSESWKQLCLAFPCFAGLHWPQYDTYVVPNVVIDGEQVVIQLWKGLCEQFLGGIGNFPGGIGAEVGVYHRIPGKARPKALPFLPAALAAQILLAMAMLTDDELWWPFPELSTRVAFNLINPITNETFIAAGPDGPEQTYWLTKWMEPGSYDEYKRDQGSGNTPQVTGYLLQYEINGAAFTPW